MKDRQEEIARWARQMGVSKSDLERFLSERSLASDGTPLDAHAALKQAQGIAADLKVTDHSELGRAVAQLMGFLKTQSGSDEH